MSLELKLDVYTRKKELFYCTIKFSKALDESLLLKVFILLDKFYPKYLLSGDSDEEGKDWKEYLIKSNFTDIIWETFYISPPFFLQKGNDTKLALIRDGISFSFFKGNTGEQNSLLINLYADLVTDKVLMVNETGYYEEDQSLAAPKNRVVLANCLKNIENFLEGDIVEYITDYHLTPDSIYKYGIKEIARHIPL